VNARPGAPWGENALAFKQPTCPYDIESGPGGLTREVETPLPSNSPRAHMILRVDVVDSRVGRDSVAMDSGTLSHDFAFPSLKD
jgi:hypothetical protein